MANKVDVKVVKLQSGCNVTMSSNLYENIYCDFTESQEFSFNNFINAGLYFPQIMQFVFVLLAILNGKTGLGDIMLVSVFGGAAFTFVWFSIKLYKVPMLASISCLIGGNLFRIYLHYIAIAAVAFFVVKDWKVLLFCAIGGLVAYLVKSVLFMVLSTAKYNDGIVRYVSGFGYKR